MILKDSSFCLLKLRTWSYNLRTMKRWAIQFWRIKSLMGHNSRIMKISSSSSLPFFPPTISLSYPNHKWSKHQRHSGRCGSFFAHFHINSQSEIIIKTTMRNQAIPSTQDGAALVVPATCPGKQEHFTVWDLSSILFLLQHRCAAITSQVPAFTWTENTNASTG